MGIDTHLKEHKSATVYVMDLATSVCLNATVDLSLYFVM